MNVETETQPVVTETNERNKQRIIDGLFYAPFSDEVAQFTGLFSYSGGEDSDAIDGLLEDAYGRSRIEGLLSESETINFNKTYGGRTPIEYKFSFDQESGLYLGTWQGEDAFRGYAACKLDDNLIQKDADLIVEYFKSFDAITDEERGKEIMNQMVGKGYFNVSQDPESGEEMVSLSEEGQKLAEEAEQTITDKERELVNDIVEQINNEDDDIPF